MKSIVVSFLFSSSFLLAQEPTHQEFLKMNYTKQEIQIPMRDGVKLFTAIYTPIDSTEVRFPIMLNRTPYSIAPYGEDKFRTLLGPSRFFDKERFIFVYQDVRGKYKSEGTFEFMRHVVDVKKSSRDTDEPSDTYDTVEWLLQHLKRHNGRVGIWGISYPGYQASMGAIEAHPAVKAVSPQAPMVDVFTGDDFHHNGAFFLAHAFRWLSGTAPFRTDSTALNTRPKPFEYGTPDGYIFFLSLGPLSNVEKNYFNGSVPVWTEFMKHGTFDSYWQSRNTLPHFRNVKPAVMTTIGWFDTEDKYGGAHLYHQIEKTSPNIQNILVAGPWQHGGWARVDGDTLGHLNFGQKTSFFYRESVELSFFNFYLKGKDEMKLPEATAFMTGANQWRSFTTWPPAEAIRRNLYLHPQGKLSFELPADKLPSAFDEYVSDPKKPVPFTNEITTAMGNLYIVEDQRFASSRTDVLVYQTDILEEDLTIAGPIEVELFGSSNGSDCDWVVKLIDVYPGSTPDPKPNPANKLLGGAQMMLASDIMRAKFRKSLENPVPLKPDQPTRISFELSDKLHRFTKGHKIMVHIQSTWFPLVDLNPGKFVDIYSAKDSDFKKTIQRVYHSRKYPTHLKLGILK
jgi:hypothetical protein